MKKTIIISAGGTGGHIFPALSLANSLKDQYQILWVGAEYGLESILVPNEGFELKLLKVVGFRNNGLVRKLIMPYIVFKAVIAAIKIILDYKPALVIGFGGYAIFPISMATKLFRIPLLIHEQNSVPGLSNRILAKIATTVLVAFPKVLNSKKTVLVGNPVREGISQLGVKQNFHPKALRILVLGGSLGAKALNEIIPLGLLLVKDKITQITHQVGRGDREVVIKLYNSFQAKIEVISFIEDMAKAYNEHDLIICRAGASTVAEVAMAGIPAIFIPYPYAVDDHQTLNAEYLVSKSAAFLIKQENLTPVAVSELINQLTVGRLLTMAENSKKCAIKDSIRKIELIINNLLKIE